MSVFSQLKKLNIPHEQVADLDSNEIIKIEKILKAEVRTNPDLDINDVEKIIEVLSIHGGQLKILFSETFKPLLHIVSGNKPKIFKPVDTSNFEYTPEFKQFIQNHFEEDILTYVDLCFIESKYGALKTVLEYLEVYSFKLSDQLRERFTDKINYGKECIAINAADLMQKLEPHTNLQFYECLNQFPGISFESPITDLLNEVVDHVGEKKSLLIVLYAMGEFRAVSQALSETLSKNKSIAIREGVRERKERNGNISAYYRGKALEQTSHKRARSGSMIGYSGMGLVIFIIFAILRIAVRSSRNFNNNDFRTDAFITEFENNLGDSQSKIFTGRAKYQALKDQIFTVQELENNKIESEDFVDFNKDSLFFPSSKIHGSQVEFINKTDKNIIVVYHNSFSAGTFFIKPEQVFTTKTLVMECSFYSGDRFQKITYNNDGEKIDTFYRFKDFTDHDMFNFDRNFDVQKISAYKGVKTAILSNNNGVLLVNWKNQFGEH